MRRVVVVGGGIAGLAAARRLTVTAPEVEVVVVEAEERLGGKILSEHVQGFVIEGAPDSFLTRKERGVGLCEELGLGAELVARRPEHEKTFVRRGNSLLPLPSGLTGLIPTDLAALESSALLSPAGRERIAREPELPPAPAGGDESIASFVRRRLGDEAWDVLVEPLMSGIYAGDGDQLSLAATFPQLRALELEHGSLLRGLTAPRPAAGGGGRAPFLSLARGMGRLVDALVDRLDAAALLTGRAALRVASSGDGYAVELSGGESLQADVVVLAVPAYAVAELAAELDPGLASAHAEIPHGSSALVSLAYRQEEVGHPLDGYGYLVPRAEGGDVLSCTWTSSKWPGRAPEGHVLLRVYAGRFGLRDVTLDRDPELVELARAEVARLGIDADPVLTRVHRWPRGMPQYTMGHLDRLDRIDERLRELPGLAVAGASYRGVGIPDCIRSGEAAADAAAQVGEVAAR